MRLRLKYLFISTIVVLTLFNSIPLHAEFLTANILQRVFLIKYGDKYGSSFTIDVDNKQYLISAKHFLNKLKDEDVIQIYHDSQWKNLNVKVLKCKKDNIDIIVLVPPNQLSPSFEIKPSIDKIILGQDVYFLGFPYLLHIDPKDINNKFPLPFIKKGALSLIDSSDKEAKILYIDGYNNEGFSGGPIVFFNHKTKKLCIAGVISGYISKSSGIKYKKDKKESEFIILQNTGIITGYCIDNAIEVIKENPIGPELSPHN